MIVWLFFLAIKILVSFAFLYFLLLLSLWLLSLPKLSFYENQGMKIATGARNFILGNFKSFATVYGPLS